MTILLLVIVLLICGMSLFQPWMGVVAYYFLAVGHPQAFFPHVFQDVRVSMFIALGTTAGFCLAMLRGQIDFRRLLERQNVLIVVMCLFVNLSASYSGFHSLSGLSGEHGAEFILGYLNKSILFYLIAVLIIDSWRKLQWLLWMYAALVLYLTYWANDVYFSGQYWRFGDNGRLNGPAGTYHDENAFAMLFVMATPVLYYVGLISRSRWVGYGLWLAIPLSWHALFLTSSRGGLLALAITSVYVFCRSYSKRVSLLLSVSFVVAVMLQATLLLNRVEQTRDASEEEVADPRLISWGVGARMVADFPLFGVGAGNFQAAFPYYSTTQPHVAHNTFLQFAAQSGLVAGLIYVFLFYQSWPQFKGERKASPLGSTASLETCSGDLIRACMFGFFCCAVFLDLQLYELLYFLLMMFFVRTRLYEQELAQRRAMPAVDSQSDERLARQHTTRSEEQPFGR